MALVLSQGSQGSPPPTTEEVDLLEQSTRKRSKQRLKQHLDMVILDLVRVVTLNVHIVILYLKVVVDWMEEEEVYETDSDEEGDPSGDGDVTRLRFSKELKMKMRARWRNTIHGKVVGKSVSYPELL